MGGLVVEKDVCAEGLEDLSLADTAEEMGLIYPDTPLAQGLDGPLMGRGTPGGDQGGADGCGFPVRKPGLDVGEGHEEIGKGALLHGFIGLASLVLGEGIQILRRYD